MNLKMNSSKHEDYICLIDDIKYKTKDNGNRRKGSRKDNVV